MKSNAISVTVYDVQGGNIPESLADRISKNIERIVKDNGSPTLAISVNRY